MTRIRVAIDIAAPVDRVWAEASDLASHAEWMADAEQIEFLTEQRSGVGTRMEVETAVGPFRTTDVMEVTIWDPPRAIGVRHVGLVAGSGIFELSPIAGCTRFIWSEDLRFPWWLGGELAAFLARPVLRFIWRRNLVALRKRIEES